MKTEQQIKGIAGEDLAVNHLISEGYKLLERNWHCGHLEVDIIVENAEFLVIVEVKTQKNVVLGTPEEFVTKQKQKNLIRAASYYCKFRGIQKEVRFDVISVILGTNMEIVNHIEDAFKPSW